MKKLHIATALFGLLLGAAGVAKAQTMLTPANTGTRSAAVVNNRWQASLDAFEAADKLRTPPPGGVLFVGSSSIRLWDDLEAQFKTLPVIVKRGFGGSRLSDCTSHLDRLVLPYKPRLVVVYAGDNDLAEGATPAEVAASFAAFVHGVRQSLPDTRIAYLSIKPSPSRAGLLPAVAEANALIARQVTQGQNLDYIDVYSKMLDTTGQPRAELFGKDRLHLNSEGYALWHTVILSHLGLPLKDLPAPAPTPPAPQRADASPPRQLAGP